MLVISLREDLVHATNTIVESRPQQQRKIRFYDVDTKSDNSNGLLAAYKLKIGHRTIHAAFRRHCDISQPIHGDLLKILRMK